MTPQHCDEQIKRLSVLRGLPEDVVEYFAALEDIPDARFTLAVTHALKTRAWFPTPAELRLDCDAVGTVVIEPPDESRVEEIIGGGRELVLVNPLNGVEIRIPIKRIWKFHCDDCLDGGWRSRQCPDVHCGRRSEHAPHEWVERCPCSEWNPTIRRRKEAAARYSQSPEKVNS